MTLERIQALYRAQPFQPFTLHLADGREVMVKSPEFMSFSPGGRTIVVNEAEDSLHIIDLLLVTEVQIPTNGSAQRPRRKGGRR